MPTRTTGPLPARPRRWLVVGAGAVALLVGATACGPVNRGSGLADQLEDALRGAPGVVAVDAGGSNLLPWTGAAAGVVEVAADAAAEDLAAVVRTAEEQMRAADGDLGVTITQDVGGTTTSVDLAPDRWTWRDLRTARDATATALAGGTLTVVPDGSVGRGEGSGDVRTEFTVTAEVDGAAAIGALLALLDVAAWVDADADLAVVVPDGPGFTVSPAGSPAAAAVRALADAGVPATSGSVTGDAAWLRVASAQVATARTVVDDLPEKLRITLSDSTTTGPGASGTTPTPTPAPPPATPQPKPARTR